MSRGWTGHGAEQGYREEPQEIRRESRAKAEPPQPFRFKLFLKSLGPGLITGASDDDPSGIGTYSQAGAQLGYGIGWTMLLTFPLMAAIQEISARVGRVTGHGISGNVCRHYPSWLLTAVVALLFIANTINIAADLGAMADATKLLIGGHGIIYVVFFGVMSVVAQIFLDYKRYVSVLKWLTLSLFAYVAALAFAHVSWGEALAGVLIPKLTWSADYFTTIVAIFGTTISPYLFFWQASQEAEDQRVDAAQAAADREALRRAKGIQSHPRRHHRRHGILQPDRAVDHRHRRRDAACRGQDRHPDFGAGGRSVASDRRRIRRSRSSRSASSAPGCWRSPCSPARPPMPSARGGDGRSDWRASRRRRPRSMPCWRCRPASASR